MMKKTLVALAAVAATASFAQSSVTITGAIATALNQNVTTTAGVTTTSTNLFNNPTGTSSVIFTGAEDLGGGMKGLFLYEIDPSANLVNAAPLSGEVFVGLSGGFGTFRMGTPNQPSLSTQAGRNPFGTKVGGGFGVAPAGVQGQGLVRMNNSMRYDSPSFGGFVASVAFAPEVPATAALIANAAAAAPATGNALSNTLAAGGAQTDISLSYANGPLALGLGFFNKAELAVGNPSAAGIPAGVPGLRHTSLFGQYAFGSVRLYLGAHNEDGISAAGVATNNTGSNIGVRYDFANMTVMANVAAQKNPATAAGLSQDRRIVGLGFDYNLSKRTAAVIRVSSQSNDNAATTEARNMMAGLIHKF